MCLLYLIEKDNRYGFRTASVNDRPHRNRHILGGAPIRRATRNISPCIHSISIRTILFSSSNKASAKEPASSGSYQHQSVKGTGNEPDRLCRILDAGFGTKDSFRYLLTLHPGPTTRLCGTVSRWRILLRSLSFSLRYRNTGPAGNDPGDLIFSNTLMHQAQILALCFLFLSSSCFCSYAAVAITAALRPYSDHTAAGPWRCRSLPTQSPHAEQTDEETECFSFSHCAFLLANSSCSSARFLLQVQPDAPGLNGRSLSLGQSPQFPAA